jgi:hypothetical protein
LLGRKGRNRFIVGLATADAVEKITISPPTRAVSHHNRRSSAWYFL